jgi:hypothetical protein
VSSSPLPDRIVDLRDLLEDVSERPWMLGVEDRYRSICAFVEGCDAALGGLLLHGINWWLTERIGEHQSDPWWSRIATRRYPGLADEGGSRTYAELSDDENRRLIDDMWSELRAFWWGRSLRFTVTRFA